MNPFRFWSDRNGNMSILFACAFAASAFMSVLAIDVGSLYNQNRQLQAGVDLAAISAVSDPARAQEIATGILADAGLVPRTGSPALVVTTGNYDASRPVAGRFEANATPVNAVRVTFQQPGTLYFAKDIVATPVVGASGVAAVTPEVSFSVGSRLASLNGGIANAVLSKLLGTTVNLSVLDYQALAAARIDAFGFLDALAGTMGVTAGSYDQLLAMDVRSGTVANTLSGLLSGQARTASLTIAQGGQGGSVALDRLFSLGDLGRLRVGSGGAVGRMSLSAMELLSAMAALSDGDRQASLALGASIPGLTNLDVDLAIGEPPQGGGWFAIGPVGTEVSTAQLRLRLRAKLLGGPVLLGAGVNLPLLLDLAPARARVAAATCPSGTNLGSARIDVLPGAASLAIGDPTDRQLRDFSSTLIPGPVRLIDLLLLRVTGSGRVNATQTQPIGLSFSSADIAAGTQKTARMSTLVGSLAGSLISGINLQVDVLGLGLSPASVIAQAVRTLITPLAPTLDMTIDAILSTLGLGLGEADVRVYGVRCHRAVLVG